MRPRVYSIKRAVCSFPAASVTPSRAHAEHVGNEFLGHAELVGRQPIQAQQQPAAELLVQRMVAIAYRRLRHLRDQCLGVVQKKMQHRPARLNFPISKLDFRL